MMVALRTLDYEPDPVPPGHGEPDPPHRFGRGSDTQEWDFDPTPVPPTPTEEIPWP